MTRPTEDQTNLEHALIASRRSTCARRAVGCVITDVHGHILGTGRNGVPKGRPHCNEGHPCPGVGAPSGTGLNDCYAIHAEVNAVAHCKDPGAIHTIYVTVSPCKSCCDMLMALPNAKRIVAAASYPGHESSEKRWKALGRTWEIQPLAKYWVDTTNWPEFDKAYLKEFKTKWMNMPLERFNVVVEYTAVPEALKE